MSEGNVQISARELLLHIMRTEGYQADRDAFAVIRQIWNEDRPYALQMRKNLNVKIARELKKEMQKGNKDAAQRLDDLNKEVFIFSAQDYFEDFMFALEWNRPPRERFYMPRRKVLRPFVNSLQDIADDRLDELFLSCRELESPLWSCSICYGTCAGIPKEAICMYRIQTLLQTRCIPG